MELQDLWSNDIVTGQLADASEAEIYIQADQMGLFSCALCSKSFGENKSNCKRHIVLVHCEKNQSAVCPLCHKNFSNTQSLK